MATREKKENTLMVDPCFECEKIEDRNRFLEQIGFSAADSKRLEGGLPLTLKVTKFPAMILRYKHLFETAPDAIFIADGQTGIILEANAKAAALMGIPVEQITGMHQSQLHPPEEAQRYTELFRKHLQSEATHIPEDLYVCTNDGEKIPVRISTSVARCGDRELAYGIFRDITIEKQQEEQLADSERKFRELYNNAPAALFRTRISDGKVLMCNTNMARMIGFDSVEECMNADFLPADVYVDENRRQELLDELKLHNQVNDFQAEVRRKDGSTLWVSVSAKISPDKDYLEGSVTDITVPHDLTKTEKKVLDIIMQGKSNKEIARILDRSVRTIEDHRSHIMHKFGVDNLVDLTQKALNLPNYLNEK